MHGCTIAPATHGLTRRLAKGLGLGLALTLVAAAAPARAAETLVSPGDGATAPAGMAVVDGKLWIADAQLGLCRVGDPATEAVTFVPGTRLVASGYCGAEGAGDAPVTTVAPSNTAQTAFDAATQNFYVAEGTSKGAGVWRMAYSAGVITSAVRLVTTPNSRLSALTLSGDGSELYFAGDGDSFLRRVSSPATAAQGTPAPVVGQFAGVDGAVAQLAELDGDVYLAEDTGVTKLHPAPGTTPLATPIPGLAQDVPGALVADHAAHRLFVGTANPRCGADRVLAYDGLTGSVEEYFAGPSFITGLGLDGGDVLVGSDAPLCAGNPAPGGGQVDRVAPQAGVPHVRITSAPAVYTNASSVDFAFASTGSGTPAESFKCTLDAVDQPDCDGAQHYTLPERATPYVFEVTPSAAGVDGPAVRHVFYVDRTGPAVSFANPAADRDSERTSLRMRFTANELVGRWECRLDAGAWQDCRSPADVAGYGLGNHVFTVRATDLAGNQGAQTAFAFARRAPAVAQPTPPSAQPTITSPATAAVAPAAPAPSAAAAKPKSCKAVAAPRGAGRFTLTGRRLGSSITPPKGARFVRLVLRKVRGKGQPSLRVAARAVKAGRTLNLHSTLSPTNAGRLRSGRYRLTVAYGTCAVGTYGAPSPLTKKGARP